MSSLDSPTSPAPARLDEEIVELEPTFAYEAGPGAMARGPLGLGFAGGVEGGSLTAEIDSLRRKRITASAIVLSVLCLAFFVWNLIFGIVETRLIGLLLGVRFAIALAVVGLMVSSIRLESRQLRWVEYFLFGTVTLVMCISQYVVNVDLVRAGEPIAMIVYMKTGVIHLFVLMILYGIFIPNDARSAAYVVLTMALALTIALTAVLARSDVEPVVQRMGIGESVLTNYLFIMIGAGLAIYGAQMTNGLRVELHEARKFGQYQLGAKIGAGGMGEVYLAEHVLLKRPCAMKLIRPGAGRDPLALARFEREVQSAGRLDHPNTIGIYDYGHTDDGTFYYVMEYLDGLSLADLVQRHGPLSPGRLIFLMRQVCAGLSQAHMLGLIHRDLKPANIFVSKIGGECDVAKVLDFGLVKVTNASGGDLTADHTVSGTPMFMAPEQATGQKDLGPQADIYALGAIAYYCLTGQPPFTGETPMAIMIAHARDPVLPPSGHRQSLPADLDQVVLRCLEKKPGDRYPDVKALSKALAACKSSPDWDSDRAEEWWRTIPVTK